MTIGRLRNDNSEDSETVPSYQNECALFKNFFAFTSTLLNGKYS